MSDAPALLAAIRAAPDDDAPRLVYADWLDEHGDPARAEFIRVQCELARHDSPALRRREVELLAAHHDDLAGPLAAPGLRYRFRRGFIMAFGHTGLFVRDRPGPRSGALSFYRFMWDGTWWSVVGSRSVEETVEMVRLRPDLFQNPDLGSYQVDALCHPARVQFGWDLPEESVDLQGSFDGSQLILDVRNRATGRRSCKRFTHVHIDGFDSFPET